MARRTLLITYIASYLLAIASIIRLLLRFRGDSFWSIALLCGSYLVLLFAEPFFIRRNRLYTLLYLFVQSAIICTLALITPNVDFWAALFCPLIVQVMYNFPQRTGFMITGIFTVIMAVLLLLGLDLELGVPLIFFYAVVYFLLAAFITIIREAEAAREEIRRQQIQLQAAHQQLQVYTTQAEELAVVEERNRLARNLHDSVTQTIFTMTLTAEAARILFDRDLALAEQQLDKLQTLAKSALAEMRSLVIELRPTAVTEQGLIPALRHHLILLERQHGLVVELSVNGEPDLSKQQAQRLFRIIQEALNNVIKYAHVDKATLLLQFENGRTLAQIEDHGQGFIPVNVQKGEHVGLSTMRERAEMMGGTLTIDSNLGEGTRITVEVNSIAGGENE